MARQVNWTDPAWQDLEAVADYISHGSEYYAAAFVQEVQEAAASLVEFADRGQIVPETDDPAIRELLIRSYRLIYEVAPDQIFILALVHGARRLGRF